MAEYCHNSDSKCPPFAHTHAQRRPCHSSIALSMMVWSMPRQTCRKRCFSSQHLFRQEAQLMQGGRAMPFLRTAAHIFVSPGDAPATITQYVARMERQFNACQTPRSMYPSIFNSFPVIRTASAKNRLFTYRGPTFLFPMETPLRL